MAQRLLFVDSDRRFIQDHLVSLESAFDVDFSYNTEGVVQRLETGRYAAILICVEVTENKGYALCSAIKKNPGLATVKVVLISAKATAEEYSRHQTLKGKADLYLHKPIDSSSLVSELTPLVPLKEIDPDNPLGDLSCADLGEEWLESLKTELETEEPLSPESTSPQPSPVPTAWSTPQLPLSLPTVAIQMPAVPLPHQISQDAGEVELLNSRVNDLETKLQNQDELREKLDQELEFLRSESENAKRFQTEAEQNQAELNDLRQVFENLRTEHEGATRNLDESATRNLDEAERRQAELSALHQEVDNLRTEAAGRETEFEELQQKLKDTEESLLAQESRATSAENQANLIQERLEDSEKSHGELLSRGEEHNSRVTELEEARITSERRYAALEEELTRQREHAAANQESTEKVRDLEDQINAYEARLQVLQDQLEARNVELTERTKAGDSMKVDIAGLEATLRGQRRELADQGGRLGGLTRDCEIFQSRLAEREAHALDLEATLLDRDSQLQALSTEAAELRETRRNLESSLFNLKQESDTQLQALSSEAAELREIRQNLESNLSDLAQEKDAQLQTISNEAAELREIRQDLESSLSALEQEMAQTVLANEKQQMELMQTISDRDAQLNRLNAGIDAQRERITSVESEKREMEGHLNEKGARLDALREAVSDLETAIRRASDLTRPV